MLLCRGVFWRFVLVATAVEILYGLRGIGEYLIVASVYDNLYVGHFELWVVSNERWAMSSELWVVSNKIKGREQWDVNGMSTDGKRLSTDLFFLYAATYLCNVKTMKVFWNVLWNVVTTDYWLGWEFREVNSQLATHSSRLKIYIIV